MNEKLTQLYIVATRETQDELMVPKAAFDDKHQAEEYALGQMISKNRVMITPLVLNTKTKETLACTDLLGRLLTGDDAY